MIHLQIHTLYTDPQEMSDQDHSSWQKRQRHKWMWKRDFI